MATTIPDATLTAILNAYLSGKDIRCGLVRTSGTGTGPYYTGTPSELTHLDDIPNNADCRPGDVIALTSEQIANLIFDADDIIITNVPSSVDAIQGYYLYDHTGTESTSEILLYEDSATGLPITPDGNNVKITINVGGILAITD